MVTIACGALFGVLGYYWGRSIYKNEATESMIKKLRVYTKRLKYHKLQTEGSAPTEAEAQASFSRPLANMLQDALVARYDLDELTAGMDNGDQIRDKLEEGTVSGVREAEKLLN